MFCILTFIIFICTANSVPCREPELSFVTLNMSGMALSVFLVVETGHGWFPKQTTLVSRSNSYCALTPCVNTWSMPSMHSTAQPCTSCRYNHVLLSCTGRARRWRKLRNWFHQILLFFTRLAVLLLQTWTQEVEHSQHVRNERLYFCTIVYVLTGISSRFAPMPAPFVLTHDDLVNTRFLQASKNYTAQRRHLWGFLCF